MVRVGDISLTDLSEVRSMIEPEIAARAAERAGPQQIEELEAIVVTLEARQGDPAGHVEADRSFHRAIATIAGNALLVVLMEAVGEPLMRSMALGTSIPQAIAEADIHHRAVCVAIKRRDPEGAAAAMQRHMEHVRRYVIDAETQREGAQVGEPVSGPLCGRVLVVLDGADVGADVLDMADHGLTRRLRIVGADRFENVAMILVARVDRAGHRGPQHHAPGDWRANGQDHGSERTVPREAGDLAWKARSAATCASESSRVVSRIRMRSSSRVIASGEAALAALAASSGSMRSRASQSSTRLISSYVISVVSALPHAPSMGAPPSCHGRPQRGRVPSGRAPRAPREGRCGH